MENSMISIMRSERGSTASDSTSIALTQHFQEIISATLAKVTYDLELMTQMLVKDQSTSSSSKTSLNCIQQKKQFVSELASIFQQSFRILASKMKSLELMNGASFHQAKENCGQRQFNANKTKRSSENQINKLRAYYNEKLKTEKFRTYEAINLSALLMEYAKKINRGFQIYEHGVSIQKQYHVNSIKKLTENKEKQNDHLEGKQSPMGRFRKSVNGIIFLYRIKKIYQKSKQLGTNRGSFNSLTYSNKLLKISANRFPGNEYSQFYHIKELISRLNHVDTYDILIGEVQTQLNTDKPILKSKHYNIETKTGNIDFTIKYQ